MRKTKPEPNAKRSFNFTEKAIATLPVPEKKRATFHDRQVPELGLLVQPSGHRSYFWFRKVQGTPTWKTFGAVGRISIEQARDAARAESAKLGRWKLAGYEGNSPFEKTRAQLTLGELHEHYVENHLRVHAKNPDRAARDARWFFGRYLAGWRNRNIGTIKRPDVLSLHRSIGEKNGRYAANRAVQHLKATFNHGLRHELTAIANPALMVSLNHDEKRKRYLLPSEMYRFFAAVKSDPNPDVPDFIGLALWTAARKSDILGMRWTDLSLSDNRWRVPSPKNNEAYDIALTPEAVEILQKRLAQRVNDNPWVFPGSGRSGHVVDLKRRWAALVKRAGLEDLHQHDLRRTNLSWQAAAGTSVQIIQKAGGHKTIAAAMVYQHMNLDPVRASVMTATRAILAASKKPPKRLEAETGG
jgi:integrase